MSLVQHKNNSLIHVQFLDRHKRIQTMKPKQIVGSAANACVQGNFTLDYDKNRQHKIDSNTLWYMKEKLCQSVHQKLAWSSKKKRKSAQKSNNTPWLQEVLQLLSRRLITSILFLTLARISLHFQQEGKWFSRQAKHSELYFNIRKTFMHIDVQTGQIKSALQPIDLYPAWPLPKLLHLLTSLRGDLNRGLPIQ